MKAKEFIFIEADLSVKGAKFIKPEEGDKVEIKFGFNDYYDRHVTRGEVMRIRPSGDAEVMIDRTAKTELFPLKFLKVLGPRAYIPGPKDTTFGTPANPELSVPSFNTKQKEGIDGTRQPLVWLQGKLRRSYSDQQLKDMGAFLQNNKWVMPRSKYQELTQSGVLEAERNEMDTPEFQRALMAVKKQAAQGPKKTVYDPKTRSYKVVPVNQVPTKQG